MIFIRQQRLTTFHGPGEPTATLRHPNSDSQGPTRVSPRPLRKYRSGEWISAEWLARDASLLAAACRRRPSVNLSDICPMSATMHASNIHRKKLSPIGAVDGAPSALPIVFVVDDDVSVRK